MELEQVVDADLFQRELQLGRSFVLDQQLFRVFLQLVDDRFEVELVALDAVAERGQTLDELLGVVLPRFLEDLLRRAFFIDAALVHVPDAVGDLARKVHLVGDDHHRAAGLGDHADDGLDFADHGGVQRGGGLVEQDDLRVHGQRARDGDTLLLTTGQLVRIGERLGGQTDLGQQVHGLVVGFLAGASQQGDLRVHDILDDR